MAKSSDDLKNDAGTPAQETPPAPATGPELSVMAILPFAANCRGVLVPHRSGDQRCSLAYLTTRITLEKAEITDLRSPSD